MKLQKTISKLIASIVLLIVVLIPITKIEAKKETKVGNNSIGEKVENSAMETNKEKFNLALRKTIKSIKDKEGNNKDIVNENKQSATRNITIKKDSNGIEYKHRKDPILVETGDIIIYEITIYNEGKQKGYATKIVDQLPGTATTGLRLLTTNDVTSTKGNVYSVEYGTTTNTVVFTLKSENPKEIPAYEETALSRETITLECQVMADINTKQSTILTNIAYILEKYNSETNEVIEKEIIPSYQNEQDVKQDGITYGEDIGYMGNIGYIRNIENIGDIENKIDLTQNNIYYKGQESDDDFEKLIILPKEFDLSLRQVITEVDGKDTEEERKITIEGLEQLEAGEVMTAQYNHIKTPVVVKKGSVVTYNINIYNEASLDGIATIIEVQLPTGLKLDLNSLYTQLIDMKTQYYTITSKQNKYMVNYDEEKSHITFTLDETVKTENIEAFSKRETLEFDTLEFECIVEYVADEKSNIYLTSIASISEEKKSDGTRITNQKGEDRDSEPYTKPNYTSNQLNTLNYIGYTGNEQNSSELGQKNTYYKGEQDDNDFEKLVILPQAFDLKLVKYVDEINGESAGQRIIKVDTSKLSTEENGRKITTAEYEMEKNPISVKALDLVKYTYRVYNEGDIDGYAIEISEEIPQGLEALMIGKDIENGIIVYSWDGVNLADITDQIKETEMYEEIIETNSIWGYSADTAIIKTTALKDDIIKAYGMEENQNYADQENNIDYKEVSVIFRVKENINLINEPIRSESAITASKAVDEDGEDIINAKGNPIQDRDSKTTEWSKLDSGKDYNEDKWEIYREDDEDYENIIVREFDLSLRKQITKITRNGKDIQYTDRYAKLDTEALSRIEQMKIEKQMLEELEKQYAENTNDTEKVNNILSTNNTEENNEQEINNAEAENTTEHQEETEEKTIYTYYDVYSNKPKVRTGDIITYSIRVYNEGEISAYASLITETLPSGLELMPYTEGDGSINDKYGWKLSEGTTNIYETDYLSYKNDEHKGEEDSSIIKGHEGSTEANYKEVEIQCRVKENAIKEDSLLSVSQIAEDSDEKGNPVKDKDSNTGKEDDEQSWKQEDDLDIEILELEEFDLALKINYDRGTDEAIFLENEELQEVHTEDVVVYTIRVYNKGEVDGYAKEITDKIPEYLEFLPDNELNKEFEWIMYDKRGRMTGNPDKAVEVKTNYLAKGEGVEKEQEESNNNHASNIIEAGKEENGTDYKEVKIAFKVADPKLSGYVIENVAQISEMTDEDGNSIKDKDSISNNEEQVKNEEDTTKIQVKYFDLALSKYIEQIVITEDNNKQIIETGNVGNKDDIIPKVEIDKNKMSETVIKFVYKIKVTNQGDIAGYAKKITDYIPEGLEFKTEDNPRWIDEGNGVISTKTLEAVLLQPQQTEEVAIVLTWKNQENNLGEKINIAEITEDYNDQEVPDRNSTPGNNEKNENDMDTSKVILSIKTGGVNHVYINLTLILCLIILVGIVLIKIFIL